MKDVFLFEVGSVRYAIPLATARELFRMPSLVPLPKAPAIIEGIVNLRGRIVPVLDIRGRFGLSPKSPQPADQILLATAGTRAMAFRIDQAIGVATLAASEVEEAKAITPNSEYLMGIAKLPDGLVLIHDPGTFLSHAEEQGLDQALEDSAGCTA